VRRFLVGGAVSALALLASCAGGDDEATPTEGANTVTVVVTETVSATAAEPQEPELEVSAGVGDTLTLLSPGGAQFSATLLQIVDPAPFERRFAPAKGSRVVAVRLRLENTGDQDYADTPGSGAALLTRDGAAFGTGVTPTKGCEDLGSPLLRPGDRTSGCLTFDVPRGTEVRYFTLTSNAGFTPEAERGLWRVTD
jgi:Domain of unknown function (DUF4352)